MIKDVWSLKLGRDILGVRVLTNYDKYYDIDIDVYKKQLKLDPSTLPSLELMEYGDLYVTEEEFMNGIFIEDASSNTGILNGVNTFVRSSMKDDPIYLARRRKKVEEISQKYYSYMPNSWLKEFGEYHIDTFDGNGNIYTTLNKEQLTIVKDYFRWRTKMIFDEQKASKVLRTKMNKARELVALMGDATDWQYDGSVDTGYMGGSHCELGHSLRYEHYAFSPSLNKQIVFGATCMSDFFEVDKKVLDNISKAQEILMKEIKAIVFIRETGKYEDYAKDYSKDLWDVLKYFKGQFNEKIANGAGWSRFIGGFHKCELPLTRSLLHKFYDLVKMQKKEQYDAEIEAEEAKREEARLAREARKEANREEEKTRTNEPDKAPSNRPMDEKTKLELIMKELNWGKNNGRVSRQLFAFTIIPTLERTGKVSDRQQKYLDDALKAMVYEDDEVPLFYNPFFEAPESAPEPVVEVPSKVRETEPVVENKPSPSAPSSTPNKSSWITVDDGSDYSDIF